MADRLLHHQQLQQQTMQRQQLQQIAISRRQQQGTTSSSAQKTGGNGNGTPSQPSRQTMQPLGQAMGSAYDDIPIDPDDYNVIAGEKAFISNFESACQHGSLSTVQSIVSSRTPPCTRFFLHHGLIAALRAGNIDIAGYLLSIGAPIVRITPECILPAPSDQQLSLFQLLVHHGWTVNTPGFYGAVLLPRIVDNLPLLRWFLDHGADPNLGVQRYYGDRFGKSDTDSCAALQAAAGHGSVEAVRLLLDVGAKIQYGAPLHYAAGVCPPGVNPYNGLVTPSKEFDRSRIPVMALLLERGADVNQILESRQVVPRYAILQAVVAGAVERVGWLLEHGADPELEGPFGTAVTYATHTGSEEMRCVIDESLRARKAGAGVHE